MKASVLSDASPLYVQLNVRNATALERVRGPGSGVRGPAVRTGARPGVCWD